MIVVFSCVSVISKEKAAAHTARCEVVAAIGVGIDVVGSRFDHAVRIE